MAAGDREAELKIKATLDVGEAARGLENLNDKVESIGQVGDKSAEAVERVADSVQRVAETAQGATSASERTADALSDVGTAARDSGQEIASSSAGATQAMGGVEAAAREESAALRATGAAAVDSGREAAVAQERLGDEVAETTAALRAQASAAEDRRGVAAVRELTQTYVGLVAQLRQGDSSLEVQRQGIQALVSDLERMTREHIESGAEGKEAADLTGNALIELKAHLADVNAEIQREIADLRKLGSEGSQGFAEIKGASLDFSTAASGAIREVNQAWEQFNDQQQITPGQLRRVAQAVAAVELAMVKAAERGQTATVEQLAIYERLRGKLAELTAAANALNNASRDNAVGLKETGNQVAGVALGVQQLTSMLGPNAAKIGMVAGNIGQLGSTVENLKDHVGALRLNAISASGAAGILAAQIGAIVGTFAAGATVGKAFAATNDDNREIMDDLAKSAREAGRDIGEFAGSLASRFGALQGTVFDIRRDLMALRDSFASGDASAYARAVSDLDLNLTKMRIAARAGEDGVRAYNLATREGFSEQEALNAAVQHGTEIMRFYNDTRRTGASGQELWNKVLRDSDGDIQKFIAGIRGSTAEIIKLLGALGLLPPEMQKYRDEAEKINRVLERQSELRRAEAAALKSESDERDAAVRTLLRESEVVNGSTEAMNRRIAVIREQIAQGDLNAVQLARVSSELQSLLNGTDLLNRKERERIQTLVDLAARGEELTAAERRYGAALAESVLRGDAATTSVRRHAEELAGLRTAIDEVVSAVNEQTAATETNETAIQRAARVAQEAIISNRNLTAEDRLRYQTIIELARQVDELSAKQKALTLQNEESAAAEQEITIIKSGQVETIQAEINRKAELITELARERTAYDEVAASAQKLIAVQENGRTVYTNLSEAQRAAGDQVERLSRVTKEAAPEVAAALLSIGTPVAGLREEFGSLNEMVDAFTEKLRSIPAAVDDVTAAMGRATAGQ